MSDANDTADLGDLTDAFWIKEVARINALAGLVKAGATVREIWQQSPDVSPAAKEVAAALDVLNAYYARTQPFLRMMPQFTESEDGVWTYTPPKALTDGFDD